MDRDPGNYTKHKSVENRLSTIRIQAIEDKTKEQLCEQLGFIC